MTEKEAVVDRLRAAGVMPAISWAYTSAVAMTLNDYSEDAGHDAVWLGCTRHTLFRDRLDRVFACGRYAISTGQHPSVGLDLLHAHLSAQDRATMPAISPDLVNRSDLRGSPGWSVEDIRLLIASSTYGEIPLLPWPQKSSTKQEVANQPDPDPPLTLFGESPDAEIGELVAAAREDAIDLDTYVVAHSLDAVAGQFELVVGRPRFNDGGGAAWHWYVDLLGEPANHQRRSTEPRSPLSPPDLVPDVPVWLRPREARNQQ